MHHRVQATGNAGNLPIILYIILELVSSINSSQDFSLFWGSNVELLSILHPVAKIVIGSYDIFLCCLLQPVSPNIQK